MWTEKRHFQTTKMSKPRKSGSFTLDVSKQSPGHSERMKSILEDYGKAQPKENGATMAGSSLESSARQSEEKDLASQRKLRLSVCFHVEFLRYEELSKLTLS